MWIRSTSKYSFARFQKKEKKFPTQRKMYKNNKRIAKLYPSLQFRPAVKAACRDLESNHGTDTFTRTFIPIYLKSHETIPRGRDIECIASMGTSIEDMLARSNQQDLVDLRETSLLRRVLCSNLLAGKLPTLSLSLSALSLLFLFYSFVEPLDHCSFLCESSVKATFAQKLWRLISLQAAACR